VAKRKKKAEPQESLEDLLELAQSRNIVEGFLDDELWDCINYDARVKYKAIADAVLLDQLEFLRSHGYQLSRIRELIEQADMAG
jgi:hypothetical protein